MFILQLLFVSYCTTIHAETDTNEYFFENSEVFDLFVKYIIGEFSEPVKYDTEKADDYFDDFNDVFDIAYESAEEETERYKIFKDNLQKVNEINNQSAGGKYGITKFMALDPNEFLKTHTGLEVEANDDIGTRASNCIDYGPGSFENITIPESLDWRDFNAITPVKNQGSCSSCYAFVAAEILEGQHALTNGILTDLSPQQMVDCDRKSNGCNRGYISASLLSVINDGGIMKEEDYPYQEKDSKQTGLGCQFDKSKVEAVATECYNLRPKDQQEAAAMLYTMGPLGVAVPSAWGLQYYTGGIIDNCPGRHDHAMFLVGYGNVEGEDVFILKNTWGENWGYKGYCLVSRKLGSSSCKILGYPMTAVTVRNNDNLYFNDS